MTLDQIADVWNRFFFREMRAEPLCLFRICFGWMLFLNALFLAPDLLNWFGVHGVMSFETSQLYTSGLRLDLFRFFSDSDQMVYFVYGLHLISVLSLMLGLFPRSSALVAFVTLTSFHHRNVLILNSGDTALRIFLFFLIWAPSGTVYSIENWLREKRGVKLSQQIVPWAFRMMQLQVSLMYLMTALHKSDGATWVNGTALYYTSRLADFERFHLPYFFEHMWSLRLMTWIAIITEYSLATLIWVREFRYQILIMGVLLHLGIEITMNIPLFQWIMLSCLILFIPAEDIDSFFKSAQQRLKK